MKTAFEKGREYERLIESKRFHLFFGWGCIIGGIVFMIPRILSFISLFLIILGGVSLYLGYQERRELNEKKKVE